MAKSQETFNKKDKEKNKLKKRQEKLLKKEERKANAKGGGLENMIAYVDEFGQISDTPIDPQKRKKVDASTIDLSYQRETDSGESKIRQGKVAFFNASKGYGFIKDLESQENVFVHINGIIDPIVENDKVSFELVKGPKGFNAVSVKKIK
jgi:cold shock CspA family protein